MELSEIRSYTGDVRTQFRYGSPALLIVDMQNAFVREGTPFSFPPAEKLIAPIRRLLDHFRENDLPVFFTEFVYSKNCPNIQGRLSPWVKDIAQGGRRVCYLNDKSAETVEELKPLPDEAVIQKVGYDAFVGTPLDLSLRALGVKTLIVVGIMADQCLLATVSGAFNRDYEVTVASDCTVAVTEKRTDAALEIIDTGYGNVFSSEEILHILHR